MANDYKYAEESDRARIAGLVYVKKLLQEYEDYGMVHTGVYKQLERLKSILTVSEKKGGFDEE